MLFFDLDGPILDVSDRFYRTYADILKEFGCRTLRKDEYWELKRIKVSDYDILCRTSSEYIANDFKAKRDCLIEEEERLKLDFVWHELYETYHRLCSQIPTVIVTLRTYAERTCWQLKTLGIYSWFGHILSHPGRGIVKDRWIIKANLIKKADLFKDIDARDCIFIGDTETDVLAGKNLGMKTIAVSFGIRTKKLLLRTKPDLLFQKQSELSEYLERLHK